VKVAEGVATAPAAVRLALKYGVDAPIINTVAAVLDGSLGARFVLDSRVFTDQQSWTDAADDAANPRGRRVNLIGA
jgi:glycerol-3-phosphate dehydrogenase